MFLNWQLMVLLISYKCISITKKIFGQSVVTYFLSLSEEKVMAQTRYKDCLKMANGFGLVAKAFADLQCTEMKQVWNNSSIRAAVQELQFQAEEKLSDSFMTEVNHIISINSSQLSHTQVTLKHM